ncbi:MAG: M18 family aminopeptidase [Oscillospiraceae bacterium]|nr:M18 family aminopeptidase [Oscillospiraceae bacterium]
MEKRINALCDFLNASHSSFHAVAYLENLLKQEGYQKLAEHETWQLTPGGKYYLTRSGTALLAFRIPTETPVGFLLSASHSDHPCFKLKENPELSGTYTRLAVERYGGQLLFTWTDRPLSLAGRVIVETENGIESRLIDIDRDLMLIPNVAIHMNRQVNDGYKWNPAVDMLPLLGGKDAKGKLDALLEEAVGGRILGHDLFLYVREEARIWGVDNEFISATALDDLECAWGCTQGFLKAAESHSLPVLCVFDNEEVGSGSRQGACSALLIDTLDRICESRNLNLKQMLSQSFMVSADNGHALHPNHPELSDPTNAPVLGGGVVLKFNATLKYCTDGLSAALFRKVCEKAGVRHQTYCNRADIAGGSTLGNLSQHHVSVPTVDIGLAQLAMHSCYETSAAADAIALEDAMTAYYSSTLKIRDDNFLLT